MKRDLLLVLVCLLAGFIGGRVADWASPPSAPGTQVSPISGDAPVLTVTGLRIVDGDGKLRGSLSVSPDGLAGLTLCDPGENARVRLFVTAGGVSLLGLCDQKGNYGALLREDNGRPDVMLMDKEGKVRVGLCAVPDGLSGLYLNQNEKQCLWLYAPAQGGPNLVLNDGQARQRAKLSLDAEGKPTLTLSNEGGNPLFTVP